MPLDINALVLDLPRRFDGEPLSAAGDQNLRILQKRLRKHQGAQESLALSGFERETVTHFRHGLSSFQGSSERYTDALTFPLLDAEGYPRKRWLRLDLVGVTRQWPAFRQLWSPGQAATYWFTPEQGQPEVVICDSFQIGWWLWQLIRGHELEQRLCLITRSTLDGVPDEWLRPQFWQGWSTIHFARSADQPSTLLESASAGLHGRSVRRVVPPSNWQSFVTAGGTADQLAPLFQVRPSDPSLSPSAVVPVSKPHVLDVNMTCHGGQLYYPYYRPTEPDAGDEADQGVLTADADLVVLRSDGKRFSPFTSSPVPIVGSRRPFPGLRVIRLPFPNQAALTFDPDTIERFVQEQRKGRWSEDQVGSVLFRSVRQHVEAAAVLPSPDDAFLLSAVVMLSYVQAAFPAVPLVSVVGPTASGKTRLARAMLDLGCNAELAVGHLTPATVASLNDGLGGLLILDDLDTALGSAPALVSLLRAATEQLTGRRVYVAGEAVVPRNAFGLKVITGRQHLPSELSERSLVVDCRPAAEADIRALTDRPHTLNSAEQGKLRQQLHLWAFEQVAGLSEQVQQRAGLGSLREELLSPFSFLARLLGDGPEAQALNGALAQYWQETRSW